jgi:hypothetical protein
MQLEESIEVGEQVNVGIRVSVASRHWRSAAYMVNRAADLELAGYTGDASRFIHTAYVTGAVTLSVSFLEAAINEFMLDCCGTGAQPDDIAALDPASRRVVGLLWQHLGEKGAILEKYQAALGAFALGNPSVKALDTGSAPYQDAALVTRLRNTLVHSKAESTLVGSSNPDIEIPEQKLVTQLRGRCKVNTFVSGLSFPDTILSADCARFAHQSCDAPAAEFFTRVGMKPRYAALERPTAG